MQNTKSLTIENVVVKYQVKETVAILVFAILIQFLIHLIPASGLPLGARLLPVFFAPVIALIFFRFSSALTVALLAPIGNYLLTGNPQAGLIPGLVIQLVIFTIIAKLLLNYKSIRVAAAPVSYIISLFAVSLFTSGIFTAALINALPGIVILLAINYFSLKLKK